MAGREPTGTPRARRAARSRGAGLGLAALGLAALGLGATACEFGPLEPAAGFRAGVYDVSVSVDDACGQIGVAMRAMDCRGGVQVVDDGALSIAWPEVDGATYVINDGALPNIGESPVLRWSDSGIEPSTECDGAALRWVVTLTNDDEGKLSGSLRNSWTGVTGCPVTTTMPQTECTTAFSYRYDLHEPCEDPCELVDSDIAPAAGEPYDCGLSVCSCP
jgi:hypothetical protein